MAAGWSRWLSQPRKPPTTPLKMHGQRGHAANHCPSSTLAPRRPSRNACNRLPQVKILEARLLRGESVDALSRELAVPIYRLEEWRDRALAGMDVGLKERDGDPVEKQLDDANRRIGELVMEIEILHKERQVKRPLAHRRSSR